MSKIDRDVLKELTGDLPTTSRPYLQLAENIGISEEAFLARARKLLREGYLRKVGAIVSPAMAGFRANGMTVFKAPSKSVARLGKKLAAYPEVTHCYDRAAPPEFPYNLYAMIHGRTRKEVVARVRKIARELKLNEYRILFSTREFKKTSLRPL
ncbi:MAG: Lrp/AsnC family transcriptional regulator [bacterium]|nr:Lrp/AsnC family transcriptional regulator [bacterium]